MKIGSGCELIDPHLYINAYDICELSQNVKLFAICTCSLHCNSTEIDEFLTLKMKIHIPIDFCFVKVAHSSSSRYYETTLPAVYGKLLLSIAQHTKSVM